MKNVKKHMEVKKDSKKRGCKCEPSDAKKIS
jgi:hypothetical protein